MNDFSLGKKIQKTRKLAGVRAADIADYLGITASSMSNIENDNHKGGVQPETVVKIATFLDDNSILLHYLKENPVYRAIIQHIFPDLDNIRRDPAIIFSRFAREAQESAEAALILAEIFSSADPRELPNFEETFKSNLEKIVDVQRCAEVLFTELIAAGVMSDDDQRDVHALQQRKCEARGHHIVDDDSCNG